MDSTVIVLIVVIVVLLVVLGVAALALSRRRRSDHARTEQLQERFGDEYERTVQESGSRQEAEAELTDRERRHAKLDIRELSPEETQRYRASWAEVQEGFVDDPKRSLHAADRLVTDIMHSRGYPVEDFDRRAEDISVSHPDVVQHYRDARAVRETSDNGADVDTDQQRRAVTSYRSLVEALLGDATGDGRGEDHTRRGGDRHHDNDDHRINDRGPIGHQTEERTR